MKNGMFLLVTALAALVVSAPSAVGQTSNRIQFAYQGRLMVAGGVEPSDRFDLRFRWFDAAAGGNQLDESFVQAVTADTNGLFTVLVGGSDLWSSSSAEQWLQLGVKRETSSNYVTLAPLQRMSPVPRSLHAKHAEVANSFTGAVSVVQLPAAVARLDAPQTFVAPQVFMPASGPPFLVGTTQRVANLNADLLDGRDSTAFWRRETNGGVSSIISPDILPIEIYSQNTRLLRLEPGGNLIGGSPANTIAPTVSGAVIAGGGGTLFPNSIAGDGGFIGAGLGNTIKSGANHATVVGGYGNVIEVGSYGATIGGGAGQLIGPNSTYAGIFAGSANEVMANSPYSVISGGRSNFMGTFVSHSVIAGGEANVIQNESTHTVISGGRSNRAGSFEPYSAIGGGERNVIDGHSGHTFIGSGLENLIQSNAPFAAVLSGEHNMVCVGGRYSLIGGGHRNLSEEGVMYGFVGAGESNVLDVGASYSAILGGSENRVRSNATYAVVLGGQRNTAGARYSLAGGHRAKAEHDGSIVFSAGGTTDFASTGADQFAVRATGGVHFQTAGAGLFLDGQRMTNGSGSATIPDGSVTAAKLADGAALSELLDDDGSGSGLDADLLDGLDSTAFWRRTTNGGVSSITSPDYLPIEIYSQNTRLLRLEPGLTVPNLIGGSSANTITQAVSGAVIAGGGGMLFPNSIAANGGFIGAGLNNQIKSGANHATVAGGNGNVIEVGAYGATIGGGAGQLIGPNSSYAGIFGGYNNLVASNSGSAGVLLGLNNKVLERSPFSAVVSGQDHSIGPDTSNSGIGSGAANAIRSGAHFSFIAGGQQNLVSTGAFSSFIGGGSLNQILNGSHNSGVAGGGNNRIDPNSYNAHISGGGDNWIQPNAPYSAILGGNLNVVRTNAAWATALGVESVAGAPFAIAAGHGAKALHSGSMVLADGQYANFYSSNVNELAMRFSGGLRFVSDGSVKFLTAGTGLFVDGVRLTGGGGGVLLPAGSVAASNLVDGAALAEILDNDGAGSGLDADRLDGLDSSAFAPVSHHHDNTYWKQGGNSGTSSGLSFMGTTDNQPLSFRVNNLRVLRLEPGVSPNIIGGHSLNFVSSGVYGATISGGGTNGFPNWVADHYGTVGGGRGNAASGEGSTVGGGVNNDIGVNSDSSVIGGGVGNAIADNALSATIAGGDNNNIGTHSFYSAIGGGVENTIAGDSFFATIAGGTYNSIGTHSDYSATGGGRMNNIASNSPSATIAGGAENNIGTNCDNCGIGGGRGNTIADNALSATIAGGNNNNISTTSLYSTIGGGVANNIADYSFYATIPGGDRNVATNYGFAAGRRAKANHEGAFVWADSSAFDFPSTASRQFNVRAVGGVRIVTGIDGSGVPDAGVSLNANDTSWNVISDRAAKKNFRPADGREILERLARLPIQHWNYKWETDAAVPHLGPTAQDFKAAFYRGRDDKTISTLEADGVALAAIQGLNQKLDEETRALRATLEARDARLATLEAELADVKRLLLKLSAKGE